MRFGLARTLEYNPIEGEIKGKDWKMFPEHFLTKTGAKIDDALNKHQSIGQGSRELLLKESNRQHQMAKKLAAKGNNKRFKSQFAATLKLECGSWSNSNTVAMLQSLHKLIVDLSGRSASNRIAQHEGREYDMVKAIEKRWGFENMEEDLEGNRARKVG